MKPLRCLVGLHAWYVATTDDGEEYKACRRCNAAEAPFRMSDASSGNAAPGPSGSGF